ncbi:unnamed protein product [Gongylonema pulchrum]|uniref:Uncharacterized protein n=1 Tax=Gongylonema pulchrum TaxID=637853 RepID=A0A183EQ85_9BILA|nr:unnamed protein product [Gongylonema pulchrum]
MSGKHFQEGCKVLAWFIALQVIAICVAVVFVIVFAAGVVFCFLYACLAGDMLQRVICPNAYAERKRMQKDQEKRHRHQQRISRRPSPRPASVSEFESASTPSQRTSTGSPKSPCQMRQNKPSEAVNTQDPVEV